MVSRTSHQQISLLGLTLQGDGNGIGVVIPQTGVDDVLTLLRGTERNAYHVKHTVYDFGTEHRVVNLSSLLRMAPLTNALHGYLQRGGLWTRTEILVLEDISYIGIVILRKLNGIQVHIIFKNLRFGC